ncbi:peptide/nickel transport system permease protein [Pontibacter akesuensis]|uniref:Peptide/nickel transport system permease protein n=1 Tax=Pontibacter akesuensis TaxID=388950 RepID=A0A1I7ICD1_9BACT|nr:ABC transporter permease [Pontibacter akesuensis]GHA66364.1 glutathione ABC transporter permease [Pontibacter akesuensis]SFU70609.1 peptide/nickel transport system permease protein [Pontibacter akesuensis]
MKLIGFILSRLGHGLLIMLGVLVAIFFLFNVLPGDPVALLAGQRSDLSTREAITKDLGLDKPLPLQLLYYVNDVSPVSVHEDTEANLEKYEYSTLVDFGEDVLVWKTPYLRRSFQSNKSVTDILVDHFFGTLWLAAAAMLIATVFGILFGVLASLRPHSTLDHTLVTGSVLGISVPSFVAAILIAITFGYYWSDWTGLSLTGQLYEIDPFEGKQLMLRNLLLPAIALGIRPLAIIVQLTRSSMLDVMSQDYIRTARAKGLSRYNVIAGHALKNALNPVVTAVSGWLASLMAGAFFIEYIFNWKGLGSVTLQAVQNLDFPLVMGSTLFVAFLFVLINILVDLLYVMLDPRVKLD